MKYKQPIKVPSQKEMDEIYSDNNMLKQENDQVLSLQKTQQKTIRIVAFTSAMHTMAVVTSAVVIVTSHSTNIKWLALFYLASISIWKIFLDVKTIKQCRKIINISVNEVTQLLNKMRKYDNKK